MCVCVCVCVIWFERRWFLNPVAFVCVRVCREREGGWILNPAARVAAYSWRSIFSLLSVASSLVPKP